MDRRESILQRLLAICEAQPGIVSAARNRIAISDTQLPAVTLHDGAEDADDSDVQPRPTNGPRRITMHPQLALLAKDTTGAIGTTINELRAQLIKAIVTDAELLTLTLLGEGSARYTGGGLALNEAREMVGDMTVEFSITYMLRPEEL